MENDIQSEIKKLVDNFNPPKAKYVRKKHQEVFTSHAEKVEYWTEEVRRWNEGYKDFTGLQYFWLQEWIIKRGKTNEPIAPLWRQDDEDIAFKPIEMCRTNRKDFLLNKRREALWSSLLACVCCHIGLTTSGGEIIYTSKDLTYVERFCEEKLLFGWERMVANLPTDIFDFRHERRTKYKGSKSGGYKLMIFDHNGEKSGKAPTTIRCIDTNRNPKAFASARANVMMIDEAPMHQHLEQVLASGDASRNEGLERVGMMYIGGSCGEIHKNNFKIYQDLIDGADERDIIVSEYMGYQGIFTVDMREDGGLIECTKNGYTNHELAKLCLLKRRKKLEKLPNKEPLWGEIKNYPLYSYEFLQAPQVGFLPDDIRLPLQEQQKIILMNEKTLGHPLFTAGMLENSSNGFQFNAHKGGFQFMLAPPREGAVYGAGIDPIPFNSDDEKGSDWVLSIKDFALNEYVFFYIQRLSDPEFIIGNSIMAQQWYNNAPAMLEVSTAGAVAIKYYKDAGLLNLLCNTPSNMSIKYGSTLYNKGFTPQAFGKTADALSLQYAKDHHDKIKFTPLINEYFQWGTGANLDIQKSVSGTELYHTSWSKKIEQARPELRTVKYRKIINNQFVIVEELVNVFDQRMKQNRRY